MVYSFKSIFNFVLYIFFKNVFSMRTRLSKTGKMIFLMKIGKISNQQHSILIESCPPPAHCLHPYTHSLSFISSLSTFLFIVLVFSQKNKWCQIFKYLLLFFCFEFCDILGRLRNRNFTMIC